MAPNIKEQKSDNTCSKMMVYWPPGAHLKDTAQNGLPELPREPPGSCRGPFREAQEGPKRRQGRPKTAPRAAKSAPKAAQRQSQSGPGGHLGPTWPQRAPRRAPGGDFCPLGDRLLAPAGLDFVAPGAFWGSSGDRFPQRQRGQEPRREGHKAKRPPGSSAKGLRTTRGRRQGRSL